MCVGIQFALHNGRKTNFTTNQLDNGLIDHYRNYTKTDHNALCLSPPNFDKHCLPFLLGVKMAPRETENNAHVKFWGDKKRVLWYVMVFSVMVNNFYEGKR